MKHVLCRWLVVVLELGVGAAVAGAQPGAVQPVQPSPYAPGAQASAEPRPFPPPFVLSPYEEAQLDRVLQIWEQQSAGVRNLTCTFTRWEYDPIFGGPNAQQPKRISQGRIIYAAPDKGLFEVEWEAVGGRMQKAANPERWICDGKSIYEYKYDLKQIVETPLPPEIQGKAIQDGPLPFLFGAEAKKLKHRYYMRVITPEGVKDEIWLEAWPRFQHDAANFQKAELILKLATMQPFGLQIVEPNGQNRTIFQFDNLRTNTPDLLRFFMDPFRPTLPDRSWTRVVERVPGPAGRPAGNGS